MKALYASEIFGGTSVDKGLTFLVIVLHTILWAFLMFVILPFVRDPILREIAKIDQDKPIPCYHHVGVYAYRRNVLNDYLYWSESHLEKLEGLEQLRFLSENKKVKCVEVSSRGNFFWELNNPEDVQRIEKVIS